MLSMLLKSNVNFPKSIWCRNIDTLPYSHFKCKSRPGLKKTVQPNLRGGKTTSLHNSTTLFKTQRRFTLFLNINHPPSFFKIEHLLGTYIHNSFRIDWSMVNVHANWWEQDSNASYWPWACIINPVQYLHWTLLSRCHSWWILKPAAN